MTADRDRYRAATAAAVLLVAAIAAVVSFVHIQHLALTHGQTPLAAALLPLSIDGTVAAASLVMLRAARAGLGTPWLARGMLALAVGATLAANIGYGLPYGAPGALLSGWPAVAFIGCAEMAIGMVRRARSGAIREAAGKASAEATRKTGPRPAAKARPKFTSRGLDAATRAAIEAASQGQPVPSARALARAHHIGRDKASQVRAQVLAGMDGQAPT